MAAYCTVDDVRGVLTRDSSDVDGTGADQLDADLIEYHIAAAQAEVDARLSRYRVPFTTVPALVKAVTVDVAAFLATLTYAQDADIGVDDPVRLRYARAIDILQRLADGSMDLPVDPDDPGTSPGSAGDASVRNPYQGRMFTPSVFGLGYERGRRRGW